MFVCVCVCGVYRYNVEQVREREHIENIVAVCVDINCDKEKVVRACVCEYEG